MVHLVCTCTFVLLIRSFSLLPLISLRSSLPQPYYFLMSAPHSLFSSPLTVFSSPLTLFSSPNPLFPSPPLLPSSTLHSHPLLFFPLLSSSTTSFSLDGSISGPSGVNPGPVEDTDGSCLRNEHDGKLTQVRFPLSW